MSRQRVVLVALALSVAVDAAEPDASPHADAPAPQASAAPGEWTWGGQPTCAMRWNSVMGIEGDAGLIFGAHVVATPRAQHPHLEGGTFGIAASAAAASNGFTYGGGVGAGACMNGGGAASARLEYIRVEPWRETHELRNDRTYEGIRCTLGAGGGAGGIGFCIGWIRAVDDRDDRAFLFGIGVGM